MRNIIKEYLNFFFTRERGNKIKWLFRSSCGFLCVEVLTITDFLDVDGISHLQGKLLLSFPDKIPPD